ncbi:hypothetical protein [Nocardioides taihuensis]|uniref:DUF2384 domain-containing protein n=1 Tax=Nocardioides taihuensis TaxID=1835606 RepID=A0ABW0BIQ8_9ACTN
MTGPQVLPGPSRGRVSGAGSGADLVKRWEQQLRDGMGLDDAEIVVLRAALADFCDEHGVTPLELCERWAEFPELTAPRNPYGGDRPRLVVESFLVTSGVNLFGAATS